MDAKAKLQSIIIQMIDTPRTFYFGAIASKLPLKPDLAVDSFAVSPDGELLFNPDYVNKPHDSPWRLFRDICHEVGHIALEHFARRTLLGTNKEDYREFNIAADCAIEALLDADFPDALGDPEHHAGLESYIPKPDWGKHSTEEMFHTLVAGKPNNQGKTPPPQMNPLPDLSAQGKQTLHDAIMDAKQQANDKVKDQLIDDAATNTKNDKQGHGQGTSSACNALLDPSIKSRQFTSLDAVKRLFKQSYGRGESKDDSTFNQRHLLRRDFLGSPLIGRHQRLDCEKEGGVEQWHNDLDIYIDVSGSMPISAIRASLQFISTLAQKYGVTPVRVYTYNTQIQEEFIITASTHIQSMAIRTGGGTNIRHSINQRPPKGKLALVLTDMEDQPIESNHWNHPDTELAWLIHQNYDTNHDNFKFGEKIYINDIV